MAISSDAPVSVDNLKAVVDKLMGGYLPETLLALNSCEAACRYFYIPDQERWSRFYVEVTIRNQGGKWICSGFIDNTDTATATLKNSANETVTVKMNPDDYRGRYITIKEQYSEFYRVIGYPKLA